MNPIENNTPGSELSEDDMERVVGGQMTRDHRKSAIDDDCPPNDCECGECNDDDSSASSIMDGDGTRRNS